jgi:predicted transcriptional regulator
MGIDRSTDNSAGVRVMSAVKEEAIRLIQSLPDDCSLEEIQYHLDVIQKVERSLAAIDEGQVVPQEEAERRVAGWGKFTGQSPPSTI